jgi:hypothetical protein
MGTSTAAKLSSAVIRTDIIKVRARQTRFDSVIRRGDKVHWTLGARFQFRRAVAHTLGEISRLARHI